MRKLIALHDPDQVSAGAAFDGVFTPRESQTASSRPILNIPTGQQRLGQHRGISEQDSLELLHKIANSYEPQYETIGMTPAVLVQSTPEESRLRM